MSNGFVQPYRLKLNHREKRVIFEYDPALMLNRIPNATESNAEDYARTLEHIKKRIDWCIRKSAGENPDIEQYGIYE